MGGAASTINFAGIKLSEKECKAIMKELFERQVFDALADSDSLVSIDALNTYYNKRTDVFLTHDWGKELGVDNHERVGRINEALKKRGLSTWFDSEKMEGNVKKKMISGIENANCIVVFVTKRYMEKVNGDNAEDNCQLEFNYASRRKTARKMVPVVMEARVRDTSQWVGEVGMVLGGNLYVDLATDDSFEARMDELYSRVLEVTGTSLKKVMEGKDLLDMINSKAHDAAQVASSTAAAAIAAPAAETTPPAKSANHALTSKEQAMIAAFQDWIIENTDVVPNFATKYATMLVEKGVGSVEKLKKKLVKNPNFLGDLGFDEDDAEEITLVALGRKQKHPEENKVVEREFKVCRDHMCSYTHAAPFIE
ncbi:toll/interleukin-1 receptor domain-containing protein [archaeon]|nr:MAG: toll/interleukin-1 receptor domain-containing protein [archaeon]